MPEWISNALWLGGGGLVAWLTLILTGRRDRKSAEHQMIDQFQEELAEFRKQTNARLLKLETENTAYRRYVFQLIDHSNAHGITPLPWPDDIPR
ncbi:hypothetical protein [Agromyces cerinus]|uniref:Uncharacterized protein n=1 Tax=Agromyces cerinus subsp. cerinus TaxID=232089 RepID=A0A1N6DQ79_9MICO|nr:hypothetical protein [Agromyces cerinus]SIN72959.1 hypothetical protein SAMN05443544_0591 [Agromyces cerinus subsp. cerinus]